MNRRVPIAAPLALACLLGGCLSWHAGAPAEPPEEGAFATLRGTRVHFVDEGEPGQPAVVLVHGFASSVGVWAGLRPALREAGYRVLALDLKGFGHTGRPAPEGERDYSPAEQARIVRALMDARGVHRAAVVAHSYGSSVALRLALDAPERVSHIALYDALVYADQLPTSFHWARAGGVGELIFAAFYQERSEDKIANAFYDPEVIPQALVDTVEEQVSRPGTRAAALAAVRAMRYEAQEARYGEVEAPTLLLWGREDSVTTLDFGERLYTELPNAELKVYPRCGHFPMIEARRPSTRDLLAFLAAHGRQPAPASPTAAERAPSLPPEGAPGAADGAVDAADADAAAEEPDA